MSQRTTAFWAMICSCASYVAVSAVAGTAAAGDAHPLSAESTLIDSITNVGFNHSEVAETAEYLSDEIGGRMTNSPAMRRAERWASDKFTGWGLRNVRTEGFDFGRGWWIEAAHVRMLTPRPLELKGIPVAWTPPTQAILRAPIIVAPMSRESDFADWKGKLSGKIVLASWPGPQKDNTDPPFHRYSDAEILKLDKFQQPVFDPEARKKRIERFRFRKPVPTQPQVTDPFAYPNPSQK